MIYFDNASTTSISDIVADRAYSFIKNDFANPSSLHSLGFNIEKDINKARKIIASILSVNSDELYFTSGGTEANNTAILGVAEASKRRGNKVITAVTEHPSVLDSFTELENRGFEVVKLAVDSSGRIDINELESQVDDNTILVSIMYVNNETGVIQDIEKIYSVIKKRNNNCIFHTDCVQAFGKHIIKGCFADIITISAHKLHAFKGVGAMYIKKGIRVKPLHIGGSQEMGFRGGTENTLGIVAFGIAAQEAVNNIDVNINKVKKVRDELLLITKSLAGVHINGDINICSPYILNLSFEDVKAEVLLHTLENEGIYVSTGSACSSKVKQKMKVVDYIINGRGQGAIRFSFSSYNTVEEAKIVIDCLNRVIPMLRKFVPR